MAQIMDSFIITNYLNISISVYSTSNNAVGQSFTGDGGTLASAKFYLSKLGSPTGNMVAKIYAHSGTFGTSSVPTGTALATSDAVDITTLTTTRTWTEFTFSGAEKITLSNNVHYIVVVEYTGGNSSNKLNVGATNDFEYGTHDGNESIYFSSNWTYGDVDVYFYVYRDDTSSVSSSVSPSSSLSSSPSASASPSLSVSSSISASDSPSSSISSSVSSSVSRSISESVSPSSSVSISISSSISQSPSRSLSSSISNSPSSSTSPASTNLETNYWWVTFWTERTEPTTTWTTRTKPSTSWSGRSKPTTTWTER